MSCYSVTCWRENVYRRSWSLTRRHERWCTVKACGSLVESSAWRKSENEWSRLLLLCYSLFSGCAVAPLLCVDLSVCLLSNAVITIAIRLWYDYDTTAIDCDPIRCITRACFHSMRFDASKKWTCQFFVVAISQSNRTQIVISITSVVVECVVLSSYRSRVVVESQLWYRLKLWIDWWWMIGTDPACPKAGWDDVFYHSLADRYEGRSKSFEPYPFEQEVGKWAYLYFSAYSPPLSVHSL